MKDKITIHTAGGVITGLLAAYLVYIEGLLFINILAPANKFVLNGIWVIIFFLSLLSFIFILRYFISARHQKLTSFYLSSILVSITATIIFFMVFFRCCSGWIQKILLLYAENDKNNFFITYNLVIFIVILLVMIFTTVFALLAKQKIKYIQYIAKEIKIIEKNGFGHLVEVTGNDELAGLCESINHMSLELAEREAREKEEERKKNELISNVSHDLRSPLTSIIGYMGLLKKEGLSNEELEEYISVISRRLDGLQSMINELFELAKLNETSVKMNYQEENLLAVLKQIVLENRIIFNRNGLSVIDDIPDTEVICSIDTEKIARAFQNLFDNARKYAQKNSSVYVSATVLQGKIKVRMANELPEGCAPDTSNLFERFYKEDVARSDIESSGLGLAITKRIIGLHGGSITAFMENSMIVFEIYI